MVFPAVIMQFYLVGKLVRVDHDRLNRRLRVQWVDRPLAPPFWIREDELDELQ